MTILYFLLLALVAAICGSISQAIVGISVRGCVISAVVGFIGIDFAGRRAGYVSIAERI